MNQMKKVFISKLDEIIEDELYYIDGIKDEKKNRIKNNIIKEMKKKFESDNFIYLILHDDHCTFKHTRGQNDGKFCCKKITENGDKKNYLCRTHNKNHIPQKRITNNKINSDKYVDNNKDNSLNNYSIEVSEPDNPNIISISKTIYLIKDDIENNIKMQKIQKIQKINYSLKYNNINKLKINKNININNFNIKRFRNIKKDENENIICKYNESCNRKKCDYKHINKEIFINDFLHKNNIQ